VRVKKLKKANSSGPTIEASSGNVFADLELPDATEAVA